jgi:hypothetical protein
MSKRRVQKNAQGEASEPKTHTITITPQQAGMLRNAAQAAEVALARRDDILQTVLAGAGYDPGEQANVVSVDLDAGKIVLAEPPKE